MSTPNTEKSLSELFNVDLTVTDKSREELQIAAKAESIDSLEQQRKYVKNNIVSLLEKGAALLEDMTTIAHSTEAAKDFQVAAQIIETLVDTNMKLLDCEVAHKPKLEQLTNSGTVTQNNTSVFVGSTSELSKFLRDQKNSVSANFE